MTCLQSNPPVSSSDRGKNVDARPLTRPGEAVDRVLIHVLVDNTSDFLSRTAPHVASELRALGDAGLKSLTGDDLCSAHHGLSLVVTVEGDNERRTALFDAGPEAYAMRRHGTRMRTHFGEIEELVLSHGHFDHSEVLLDAVQLIRAENEGRNLPLHVHPGAFVRRGFRVQDGSVMPCQDVPSVEALERVGVNVRTSTGPREILSGLAYVSGEVPRVSTFERGMRNHVREAAPGVGEDDQLVMDEQFMAVHVLDDGLVVLTGCSHASIINILTESQRTFPNIPLFGLIGGLQLTFSHEDLSPQTVEALRGFGLSAIAAGHCAAWRAIHTLSAAFSDNVVQPLAVGSRHAF